MKKTKQLFIIINLFLLMAMPGLLFPQDSFSLSFDGENDYVRIEHIEEYYNLGDFTWSCWIKLDENILSLLKIKRCQ